jgi:SAM-dependent methyltransferase
MAQFHAPSGLPGWVAGWIMAHRASNVERNRWAVGLLDVRPTDTVLEIGFGPGIAIGEIAARATGGRVCGLDHSPVMLRQATRRNRAAVGVGRVDLRCGSVDDPDALDGFGVKFDKVLAVNVVGIWSDPVGRLRDVHEVVAPGGTIAVVTQPRCPGATAATSAKAAETVAEHLTAAGFTDSRVETLDLAPPVVCVRATRTGRPG